MQLIKAKNLYHSFDYPLFEDVNFELNSSESIAIVGKSGSGKSTLLNILSSFLVPIKGEVTLFNHRLDKLNELDIDKMRRFDLGMIFQFHHLFKGMKAIENIEIATILSNSTIDMTLFDRLEIASLINQKTSELSGGQQQRVSIARVLSKKPKIIFADEPTGNLDKETANLVMNVLKDYVKKENAGLIVVTHDKDVAKMCDKIFELENKSLKEVTSLER
ncbi:MAG: ABC transporter ATP-binding protein [Sulfurovaceae bacterium]|nr:ABC transporter ATP-binding protein [Sulfurovaceae bacterium]